MPAWADILDGKFAAAVEPYRQMFDMDPSNPMARLFYVWVLILNRHTEEIDRLVGTFPPEVRDTVPARLAEFLGARRRRATRPSACYGHAGDRDCSGHDRRVFQAPRPGLRARGYA